MDDNSTMTNVKLEDVVHEENASSENSDGIDKENIQPTYSKFSQPENVNSKMNFSKNNF